MIGAYHKVRPIPAAEMTACPCSRAARPLPDDAAIRLAEPPAGAFVSRRTRWNICTAALPPRREERAAYGSTEDTDAFSRTMFT